MWSINKKWTWFFAISHVSGCLIATAQTIWIVYEIRHFYKKILKELKNK